jgi:hypothetical protein
MAVGIRCADHATPIRKSCQQLRRQAAVALWVQFVRGVCFYFENCFSVLVWLLRKNFARYIHVCIQWRQILYPPLVQNIVPCDGCATKYNENNSDLAQCDIFSSISFAAINLYLLQVNFKVCDVWQKGICKLYLLH